MKRHLICDNPNCRETHEKETGEVNRAKNKGLMLYCSISCAGEARRTAKSKDQRVKEKAAYDKQYRETHAQKIRERKREWFQKTYDKEKAKQERSLKYDKHLEYLNTPKYKAWKKKYDQAYRANKYYGELSEAAIILYKLESAIDRRETRQENNLHNKSQKRKRSWTKNSQLPR